MSPSSLEKIPMPKLPPNAHSRIVSPSRFIERLGGFDAAAQLEERVGQKSVMQSVRFPFTILIFRAQAETVHRAV